MLFTKIDKQTSIVLSIFSIGNNLNKSSAIAELLLFTFVYIYDIILLVKLDLKGNSNEWTDKGVFRKISN